MRPTLFVCIFSALAAAALVAGPADAAPKKKPVVYANRDHTVFTSTDEDGKRRTRIIIQKRSYLDPGTESFTGERSVHEYAQLPNQRASGVLDNTVFGGNRTSLPNLWTIPLKDSPWLQF
jgi:hypothetical protein